MLPRGQLRKENSQLALAIGFLVTLRLLSIECWRWRPDCRTVMKGDKMETIGLSKQLEMKKSYIGQ